MFKMNILLVLLVLVVLQSASPESNKMMHLKKYLHYIDLKSIKKITFVAPPGGMDELQVHLQFSSVN